MGCLYKFKDYFKGRFRNRSSKFISESVSANPIEKVREVHAYEIIIEIEF